MNTATGTTTWYLSLAKNSLTSGNSYSVIAEATDSLGSTDTSSPVTFSYLVKTAPPTVCITYPVDNSTYGSKWAGEITGTASAGTGASISTTAVAIEDMATSQWWNGSTFTGSETWNTATGTTTWLLGLPTSDLTSGVSYNAVAEATDSLGNVGTSSTVSFTYLVKTDPPTVAITYPVNNTTYGTDWTGTITGTASSNSGTGTSITSTSVAVENATTGKWWSSGSFSASSPSFAAGSGTTSWSLAFAASNLTSGDDYGVVAEATDSLGNTGTSSAVTFTYDTAPPSVAITYPVTSTAYGTNWTGTITGTASSNAEAGTSITSASVAVENTTTGKWWNGSSFKSSTANFAAARGTTSWTFAFPARNLTSGDGYSVIAEATDSAGNIGTSATVSFTYDSAPPTVTITYPVTKANYGSTTWSGTITGTASSNAGAGTAVAGVSVAIENTSTKRWWNGTSFSAKTQTFVAATNTTSWTLALATTYLAANDSYSVVATATDSLGNLGTSPTVTFTYS